MEEGRGEEALGSQGSCPLRSLGLMRASEGEGGVADGIRTRNNKLHKLGLYH